MGDYYINLGRMPPARFAREMMAITITLPFLVSILILVGAALLSAHYNISAACTRVLLWPMVAVGISLIVIYTMCCTSAREDMSCLVLPSMVGFSLVTLGLLVFIVFGYVAVGGIDFSPIKVREYNLTDYSGWLRGRVSDPQYWATISACVRDRNACKHMRELVRDPQTGMFVPEFSWAKVYGLGEGPMPIESGCCKPPSSCGFTYVNGTTWVPTPGASPVETNVDCSSWSNDQQKLCFQCDSCKAGLLDEMKKGWTIASIFCVMTLIGLIVTCYGVFSM